MPSTGAQGKVTHLGAGRGRCGMQSAEGQHGSSKALAKGVGVGKKTEIRRMETDTHSRGRSSQGTALEGAVTRGRGQVWAHPAPRGLLRCLLGRKHGMSVWWRMKAGTFLQSPTLLWRQL